MLKSTPPIAAKGRNPTVACSRPANTNVIAMVRIPMLKVSEVSERAQPNSCSSGSTKTLQA